MFYERIKSNQLMYPWWNFYFKRQVKPKFFKWLQEKMIILNKLYYLSSPN